MSEDTPKPTCFIAMPISTPDDTVARYRGHSDHFTRVLEELFIPAVEAAGLRAIPPGAVGAENIHARIIQSLQRADLVLVDLSTLNPNVLFEFGVRTALNRPVCPVRDEFTKSLPFDATTLNTYRYSSCLDSWIVRDGIPKLRDHIFEALAQSDGKNSLWRHFGIEVQASPAAPPQSVEEKIDLVLRELARARHAPSAPPTDSERVSDRARKESALRTTFERVTDAMDIEDVELGFHGHIAAVIFISEKDFTRFISSAGGQVFEGAAKSLGYTVDYDVMDR